MSTPLVSICLPNLNTRPFLAERMESLLGQTFTDWELIISDNYSDDGSWEFLQEFKHDPRIRLSQATRRGMYANWNACLRQARGEYIYIATSDDTASPDLLTRLLVPFTRFTDIDLAICDYQIIDEHGKHIDLDWLARKRQFLGEWLTTPSLRDGKTEFLLFCAFQSTWVTMTCLMFRRKLLDKIGYFRTDRGSVADLEWSMRAILASDLAYVPGRLATWRIREGQGTSQWLPLNLARTHLLSLESVIHDHRSGIPETWKTLNGWEQRLASVYRMDYLDALGLFRNVAKNNPGQFVQNVMRAMRTEPKFLFSQALCGFAWSHKFSPDRIQVANDLIRHFAGQWPPKIVSPGW
jgi:glycosyltransferase involved in cell wall biosynthesis